MTPFESDPLWARLRDFQLDEPGARLSFSRRLARENGWSPDYARRVIEEYRRFCYLTRRAGHPVTPSDQVDQVWHLHLAYTRSYWTGLCGEVLEAPLHHGPTRGGRAENAKYHDLYGRTLRTYAEIFGAPPPEDVWPTPEQRFRDAAAFRRVNTAAHWVIPKPAVPRRLAWGLAGLLVVPVLAACVKSVSAATGDWLSEGDNLFLLVIVAGGVLFAMSAFGRSRGRKRRRTKGRGSSGCGGGCTGCGTSGGSSKRGGKGDRDDHHDESGCSSDSSGCSGCGGGCD